MASWVISWLKPETHWVRGGWAFVGMFLLGILIIGLLRAVFSHRAAANPAQSVV